MALSALINALKKRKDELASGFSQTFKPVGFGETLGKALSAPTVNRTLSQNNQTYQNNISQALRMAQQTSDPAQKQRWLKLAQSSQGLMEGGAKQVQSNYSKTPGQIVGEGVGTGLAFVGGPKLLTRQGLPTLGMSGALGGAFAKLGGGSFAQGVGQGLGAAPSIRAFTSMTDPLIKSGLGKLGVSAAPGLAGRTTTGLANVAQGIGMDIARGQKPNAIGIGADFVLGATKGPSIFDSPTRQFAMDKLTMDELIQAEDMLRNPQKYVKVEYSASARNRQIVTKQQTKQIIDQAARTIDEFAGKYLPNKELARTAGDAKAQIKALVDLNSQNRLTNVSSLVDQGQNVRPGVASEVVQAKPAIDQSLDPVQKIITALKQAKPMRGAQEELYSQARKQKFAKMMSARGRSSGEQGFYGELGSLKGQLPKVEFETLRKSVTQGDIDTLFNRVNDANIGEWEKITAKTGLSKILGEQGGAVPTKGELSLLDEVFGREFTQTLLDKRSTMQKLMAVGGDMLNLPRSLMASFDLSAPMRQGVFLIGRPKQWAPAFKSMIKSFGSEKAYQSVMDDIASRPSYKLMRENRLALTNPTSALAKGEEAFMSNLAEKIPLVGAGVKASDRAYSAFLNKLRADVFDDLLSKGKDLGVADNPNFAASVSDFVNAATGRGKLPNALSGSTQLLNGLFFSPRLMASRLNLLNPAYYAQLEPTVRKEALKSLFTFAGTGMTVLTLANLAGADVGTDPRSSDFGKIKIGNTRYDIWGGFQQYVKLAGQLISGKLISSTTGKEYTLGEGYKPLTRLGIMGKFLQSKEAPVMSFVTSMLEGSNALGDKFSLPEETISRLMPMMVQDIYELAKEWGPKGVLMGVPGIFGVGSQTYGRQIPSLETTPAGNQTIKLKSVPGLAEDIVMKLKGESVSNIPQDQWQGIVQAKNDATQKSVLKDKVLKLAQAGKMEAQGDFVPIVVDGKVKVIDLSESPKTPKLTGQKDVDKKLLSRFNSEITSKTNDIIDLYEAGYLTPEEAQVQIQALQALKQSVSGGGGKKLRLSAPPSLKFDQPSIKLGVSQPKLKAIRVSGSQQSTPSLKLTPPKRSKVTISRPKGITLKG